MTEESRTALFNLITANDDGSGPESGTIKRALQVIRSHLGMEVAYVSEFVDGRSVFREVDAPGLEALAKVGDSHSLDDVYCRHILAGRLPELIPDTAANEFAATLPITKAANIGSHMSVPIRLADSSTYGMFCCLGFHANPSLNQRDLGMMRAFADLAAYEINRNIESEKAAKQKIATISNVIEDGLFSIVYQPIWSVATLRPVGLECLTRFSATPSRPPDVWFNEAAAVGLGKDLELAAIRAALRAFSSTLPETAYLALNASPDTVVSGELSAVFDGMPLSRIVLEVTEHAHVVDYDRLLGVLEPLRQRGVRLAVDDAGAGYSGLQHILQLRPDIIKLDMALTRHIDLDPARRALASALISFARDTDSRIVAEGVETASELRTLSELGVQMAQGYFLARPMSVESAVAVFDADTVLQAQIA